MFHPNRSHIRPKPRVPVPTLGLHCSWEMRARKGMGEQPQGRDVVSVGNTNTTAQRAPCRPPSHCLGQDFRGTRAHRASLPAAVLRTSSASISCPALVPLPVWGRGGVAALPAAWSFHQAGLTLHPQISPLYLTLLPLRRKAQMAHSSLGGVCKGKRGIGKIPARAQLILLVLNAFQMCLKAPEGRGVQSHCN